MSNTYAWVISQLDCYPEHEGRTNVVFNIHWRRKATDGVREADVYGTQMVTLDSTASFTPYNKLTKTQIEGWLKNSIGTAQIAALDANLDKQIADQVAPSVNQPSLPWSA